MTQKEAEKELELTGYRPVHELLRDFLRLTERKWSLKYFVIYQHREKYPVSIPEDVVLVRRAGHP